MANALFESFDNGTGSLGNGWGNINTSVPGQVTLSGHAGLMEWATGPAAGHGYGTYTVTAKIDGNEPGAGIVLWPGNDQWPGQEMDIVEVYSGQQYATVHWNNNGYDDYLAQIFEGVQGGVFHDYQMTWEPGKVTVKVDGAVKATFTDHVPVDFDHGGINNTIGILNQNANTAVTVTNIDYTPLGGTAPSPVSVVGVAGDTTDHSNAVPVSLANSPVLTADDWNALAAEVTANFAATGHWFHD